ncbi:hypothetical protein EJB05_44286, partial [Eragrostis curvula]
MAKRKIGAGANHSTALGDITNGELYYIFKVKMKTRVMTSLLRSGKKEAERKRQYRARKKDEVENSVPSQQNDPTPLSAISQS